MPWFAVALLGRWVEKDWSGVVRALVERWVILTAQNNRNSRVAFLPDSRIHSDTGRQATGIIPATNTIQRCPSVYRSGDESQTFALKLSTLSRRQLLWSGRSQKVWLISEGLIPNNRPYRSRQSRSKFMGGFCARDKRHVPSVHSPSDVIICILVGTIRPMLFVRLDNGDNIQHFFLFPGERSTRYSLMNGLQGF